jgi:6,7-dimethyl-8-ribityllumazine synthase
MTGPEHEAAPTEVATQSDDGAPAAPVGNGPVDGGPAEVHPADPAVQPAPAEPAPEAPPPPPPVAPAPAPAPAYEQEQPRPEQEAAEPSPAGEPTTVLDDDPFAAWPQPESGAVIEDLPEEGVSVEHVEGEIDVPDGYAVIEGSPSGRRRSVAVVVSRFNGGLTNRLLAQALETLAEAEVTPDAITVVPVPGAFELPLAAMALAKTRRYACVVALGAIVRGETPHFDYVASEAASGLQLAGIETGVPVSFGVLTVESVEQGEARIYRAADAVRSALEMADVFAQLRAAAGASG